MNSRITSLIAPVLTGAIVAAVTLFAPVSSADERLAEDLRATLEELAPQSSPTSATSTTLSVEKSVDSEGDYTVSVSGDGSAPPVSITLPETTSASDEDDSLLSFATENHASTLFASATSGGAAVIISLADDSAPATYSFNFSFPDGSVVAPDGQGGFDVDLPGDVDGRIMPPWAKDSQGRDLSTAYAWNNGELTQSIEFGASTAFPVTADPAWNYTRTYTIGGANPASSRSALKKCFNCIFPVEGAPKAYPAPGQYLPLVVGPVAGSPVKLNFNCIFRNDSYVPRDAGFDAYAYGFVFDAAASHVDGSGSWISFNIRNKPIASGQVRFVLEVYGSIVNKNPGGIPQAAYIEGASATWQSFANNLATKAGVPNP